MHFIDKLPWSTVLILCATIGLAPFAPPHVWEKLQMLVAGDLVAPIDIFDLAMHGAPWLLAAAKGLRTLQAGRA
ncbi:RND transporter [Maritimibacter sp. DP1N21-5]|uniref:RND transporter n=1 Tax=Maritimibacter sp. DP1N21-5 TaxID=2836867 RepID=UPI001C482A34|nr:RND transporter [Maritimibacter sp. DP1N21-5]MBV7409734.1 RND transporter [Maritimibacter sp. DP1N21-5]